MFYGEFGNIEEEVHHSLSKAIKLATILKTIENRRDYEKHLATTAASAYISDTRSYAADILTEILGEIDLMIMPTAGDVH